MFCVNLQFISTENTRKLRRMCKQSVPGYIIMMQPGGEANEWRDAETKQGT